jgi:hypothetical protein
MAESIIFQCDVCGQKSEEEPADLPRRDRCRVELVFRGQRFFLTPPPVPDMRTVFPEGLAGLPGALPLPPGAVVGVPPFPPLADWSSPVAAPAAEHVQPPTPEEDHRVGYTLCDACMKRTCAFFDLKAETFEEYAARTAHEAELSRRAPIPGTKGEMVAQYPTRKHEHLQPPQQGPWPGGLVDQFPTPRTGEASAPVSVTMSPNGPEAPQKKEPDQPASEAE